MLNEVEHIFNSNSKSTLTSNSSEVIQNLLLFLPTQILRESTQVYRSLRNRSCFIDSLNLQETFAVYCVFTKILLNNL